MKKFHDVPKSVYSFPKIDKETLLSSLGKEKLQATLKKMLLIRNFELRAESAYQSGKIGGFFHAYTGQEAIQTAAVDVFGIQDHWYTTTYRCHALALLLGATPNEIMAELYGRATGNAKGRGGSMHLYADRLTGGFGIVGGHVPIAVGCAFSLKYQNQNGVSLCFMGDGSVAQGAFHESLNIAALWDLPCIIVIENNQWGMGTHISRAISQHPMAESMAKAYGISGYSMDGMDYFACYDGFQKAFKEVRETSKPVLIEAVTERFKGHSISDPGLYRSKDSLEEIKQSDPIRHLKDDLLRSQLLTDDEYEELNQQEKEIVMAAMKFADESPWPDPVTLEEDVFAP